MYELLFNSMNKMKCMRFQFIGFCTCYNTSMKLIRTFEITSDEFYDYLEDTLLEDIQKTTKRKITKKVIHTGYVYDNPMAQCKITIDRYERGHFYQSTAHTKTDFIRVSYETEETPEGLKITFEQFVSGVDDEMDKKNFLSRQFHSWISFGRMSRTLYDMRTDILNKRNGIKPVKNIQEERYTMLKKVMKRKYEDRE